jgi:hypothetical protein
MNENNAETTADVGTLDIVIKDPKGLPISDLEFQVFIAGQSVFSGKTDANGNGKTIEGLKIGSIFEVHVKTDKGVFKKVAIGNTQSEECTACLTSPKTRFEFSSYADAGKPGKAEAHKEKVIEDSKPKTADPVNPVVKKPHTVTNDQDINGKPVALVTNGAKVLPALAANVIAALPQVDGKGYAEGVPRRDRQKIDPTTAPIPDTLVCNEYVFFDYGRAGEKIPYSRPDQIAYFKQQNRFTTVSSKGEVGDVGFFGGHEAIVIDVKEQNGIKWYRYSGAHLGKKSGAMKDKDGYPLYISQDGRGASMIKEKLAPWSYIGVPGYTGYVGFGKAGR